MLFNATFNTKFQKQGKLEKDQNRMKTLNFSLAYEGNIYMLKRMIKIV